MVDIHSDDLKINHDDPLCLRLVLLTDRNILENIDNEIHRYNCNMCRCLNTDWSNIHRYPIDRHHPYKRINIGIRNHWSRWGVIRSREREELNKDNIYSIDTRSIAIAWLRKTIIHRFGTSRSSPTGWTVTSIWANLIDTPNLIWSDRTTKRSRDDHLRSAIATDRWKHFTFIDIDVTFTSGVRRWTHTTILPMVKIVTGGIAIARWRITGIHFDTWSISS